MRHWSVLQLDSKEIGNNSSTRILNSSTKRLKRLIYQLRLVRSLLVQLAGSVYKPNPILVYMATVDSIFVPMDDVVDYPINYILSL